MSSADPDGFGAYPKSAWAAQHAAKCDPALWERDPILDRRVLRLERAVPVSAAVECTRLLQAGRERSPARDRQIAREAFDGRLAHLMLEAAGLGEYQHAADMYDVLLALGERLDPIVFAFKERFARARPDRLCTAELKPLWVPGDTLYPAHGAYPSGHATVVHVYAGLLSLARPDMAQNIDLEARRIARNREVAGFHYPSDTAAGEALAGQIVVAMLAPDNPYAARIDELKQRLQIR